MKKYIEEFVIVDEFGKYMISEHFVNAVPSGHNTYVPWEGGSAIHKGFNTIGEARQYIFSHVKEQIAKKIGNMQVRISTLTHADTALGDDVFNLAKYKI